MRKPVSFRLDEATVRQARENARQHGIQLARLIENWLREFNRAIAKRKEHSIEGGTTWPPQTR